MKTVNKMKILCDRCKREYEIKEEEETEYFDLVKKNIEALCDDCKIDADLDN